MEKICTQLVKPTIPCFIIQGEVSGIVYHYSQNLEMGLFASFRKKQIFENQNKLFYFEKSARTTELKEKHILMIIPLRNFAKKKSSQTIIKNFLTTFMLKTVVIYYIYIYKRSFHSYQILWRQPNNCRRENLILRLQVEQWRVAIQQKLYWTNEFERGQSCYFAIPPSRRLFNEH